MEAFQGFLATQARLRSTRVGRRADYLYEILGIIVNDPKCCQIVLPTELSRNQQLVNEPNACLRVLPKEIVIFL